MGTASHLKITAAIMEKMIKMYFERLSFTERFLNFKAIKGSLLTIKPLTINIRAYKNNLFVTKPIIVALVEFQ